MCLVFEGLIYGLRKLYCVITESVMRTVKWKASLRKLVQGSPSWANSSSKNTFTTPMAFSLDSHFISYYTYNQEVYAIRWSCLEALLHSTKALERTGRIFATLNLYRCNLRTLTLGFCRNRMSGSDPNRIQ